MKLLTDYLSTSRRTISDGWDRFWFTPTDPATLGLIRILAGAMLVYTHLVWTKGLDGFLSHDGQLTTEYSQLFHGSNFGWSYLHWIKSAAVLWVVHILGLIVLILFTLGVGTRITGVLSFLITVSYANRAAGALFGLDQVNGFLALYLAIGPAGACYSIDSWLARRWGANRPQTSIGANVSTRLIQLHMCLVYLVAGASKLRSDEWWNGEAIWRVFTNYEYQTVDLLWTSKFPFLTDLFTHATIIFEVGYIALIWPKLTRPVFLAMAVCVHLTIGVCVGMMTFGLIMIVGNLAFIAPGLVRHLLGGQPAEEDGTLDTA